MEIFQMMNQLIYLYAFNTIHSSNKLSIRQKENVELIIKNLKEYMIIGLDLSHKYKQMEKSSLFDCSKLSNDAIYNVFHQT